MVTEPVHTGSIGQQRIQPLARRTQGRDYDSRAEFVVETNVATSSRRRSSESNRCLPDSEWTSWPNRRGRSMLNPVRVDAAVDLAYGALIVIAVVMIATLEFGIGLAFALGVFASYALHVVWKMARFDPDWMTKAVEESVGEQMQTVERSVEETVGKTVEQEMEKTVQAQVGETVEQSVEATVQKTVGDQVEATVGETVEQSVQETVGEQVEATVGETVEQSVQETVEQSVGETVEKSVEETVQETVEQSVEETVQETVEKSVEETVGQTVEKSVEETVGETVEKSVEETVGETVEETVGEQLETVQEQVEAVDERINRRPREDQVEELIEQTAGKAETDDETKTDGE
ncbi:hypothetical protein AArcMg_0056 [Natrarchaeobaculum sulfurireducens]|uniref:Glutamate/valine-rich protein n=2 Tax=Natrarchaeobaculum sulfurireducens TaxID=2044521 RepID=A0A346PKP4_9EURY|nr:hypothetical protein AArcMg_0056 [Natrarchaeobaculum sulfurireducens]